MKKSSYPNTVLLLAAALLLCVGCGDTQTDEVQPSVTDTEVPVVTDAPDYVLAEKDYAGEPFIVYAGAGYNESFATEENGEPLNDAKFQMVRTVEEAYNVDISEYIVDFWGMNDGIRQLILSGDTTYDSYATMDMYAIPLTMENCFIPLQNIESIQLDQPWWGDALSRELTVAGNLFYALPSINMHSFNNTSCLMMNTRIAESLGIEIPYDDVFAGTWTIDDYLSYRGMATKDLNGDGVMDEADAYTYGTYDIRRQEQFFWFGFGGKYVDKDQDDIPYVTVYDNEKYLETVSMVYDMVYSGNDRITQFLNLDDGSLSTSGKFINGDIFITTAFFGSIASARDMEDDFAILPLPKYDETQERYYSWVDDPTFYMVPTTQDDIEFSGAVLDALACVAHYDVVPALIETTLQEKASRDEQSKAVISLCFDSRTVEFGESALFDYFDAYATCKVLWKGTDKVTSNLEKKRKRIDKALEKMVSFFTEYST